MNVRDLLVLAAVFSVAAVLSAALVTISLYVDVEVEQQADCKVREWFG